MKTSGLPPAGSETLIESVTATLDGCNMQDGKIILYNNARTCAIAPESWIIAGGYAKMFLRFRKGIRQSTHLGGKSLA